MFMEAAQSIELIQVDCPTCKVPSKRVIQESLKDVEDRVEGDYSISECLSCGLDFLSTRPTPESLPNCYPKNYHIRTDRVQNFIARFLYGLRSKLRLRRIEEILHRQPRNFLEIGCGDGAFLVFLEKNWRLDTHIFGTEMDIEPIRLPRGSRITLFSGKLRDHIKPQQLDAVVLYEVLEHLPNPLEALLEIYTLMQVGAKIMGTVPNFGSFWNRVFRIHWPGLQIPRHLTFFTPDTLAGTFERAQLSVESVKPVFDPGELAVCICNWMTDKFGLKTPSRLAWFYLPLVLMTAPMVWLQLKLFKSSGTIEFVAVKNDPRP